MKKLLKILGYVVGVIVALIAVALIVVSVAFPRFRPAPSEKIDATPERLARGRYLAENVAGCIDCHTRHDWTKVGGPVDRAHLGAGGDCYTPDEGLPGSVCPPNVTPDKATGIGAWTDGEVVRAIREGVDQHNRALFPLMPFDDLAKLSDEDVRAIVVYLRSLPPVVNQVPARHLDFPFSIVFKLFPTPLKGAVTAPAATDNVQYGRYLATVGGCHICHTSEGGSDFGGGNQMKGPWGDVMTANITPDKATGIGNLTREQFIALFKTYATLDPNTPRGGKSGSPMPWRLFSGMSEQDLGALYAYLQTVKPLSSAAAHR